MYGCSFHDKWNYENVYKKDSYKTFAVKFLIKCIYVGKDQGLLDDLDETLQKYCVYLSRLAYYYSNI